MNRSLNICFQWNPIVIAGNNMVVSVANNILFPDSTIIKKIRLDLSLTDTAGLAKTMQFARLSMVANSTINNGVLQYTNPGGDFQTATTSLILIGNPHIKALEKNVNYITQGFRFTFSIGVYPQVALVASDALEAFVSFELEP